MIRLALIRHGPTEWTRRRRIHGRADPPLDDEGRAEVASWTVPEEFRADGWWASPLRRARETAEILLGRPAAIEARLVEMDWGEWQGRELDRLRAEFGQEMRANEARGLDFRPPGGESPREVQVRLRPFLCNLAARGRPSVAVTHKGVIRAVYAWAIGWDMKEKPRPRLQEAAVHVFGLDRTGAPEVVDLNVSLRSP